MTPHAFDAIAVAAASPLLGWIPLLPLLAFAILILVGRRLGRVSAWLSVAALAAAFVLTGAIAPSIWQGEVLHVQWLWLPGWTLGLRVDALSWTMLAVVTSIGTLIQLYSIGYMHGDPRVSRFFAYLSLFCASMLGLVMADHFVLLYACWELVGLCSYLLISFWFEKPEAAAAGRKAFLTTRIGDAGLLLGILLLAFSTGTLQFAQLGEARATLLLRDQAGVLTWISVLIFLGAVGKSAQIPLHVWLPDAMEGPTPVSALIHAATMVAAGVYLVARTFVLFTPESLSVVLSIGLATHLLAGTIALTMTDIKRVLAYSTISQLGLMMTALGLGARELAMFHLVTHAYFKALLFLGAGSVIHATHQQELGQLGGLFRAMPWTAGTFLVAALAMSGVPLLSGFWSKDTILLAAGEHSSWIFWTLIAGSLMTAGYIFRLYLRCFHLPAPRQGRTHEARQAGGHIHESPPIMTVPLALLAVGAAAVGLLGSPFTHHWLLALLGAHHLHEGVALSMVVISAVLAGGGAWLAWQIGVQHRWRWPAGLRPLGARLYRLASNKYFVDEFYGATLIRPFLRVTERLSQFDRRVIDSAVDGAGRTGWSISRIKDWADRRIVDRLVNALAAGVRAVGASGRRLQTGIVHHYLLAVAAAAVMLALWVR